HLIPHGALGNHYYICSNGIWFTSHGSSNGNGNATRQDPAGSFKEHSYTLASSLHMGGTAGAAPSHLIAGTRVRVNMPALVLNRATCLTPRGAVPTDTPVGVLVATDAETRAMAMPMRLSIEHAHSGASHCRRGLEACAARPASFLSTVKVSSG